MNIFYRLPLDLKREVIAFHLDLWIDRFRLIHRKRFEAVLGELEDEKLHINYPSDDTAGPIHRCKYSGGQWKNDVWIGRNRFRTIMWLRTRPSGCHPCPYELGPSRMIHTCNEPWNCKVYSREELDAIDKQRASVVHDV